MSNDLISRKAALETLFKNGQWCCNADEAYEKIKNLPTAYDVDTVCEEIQKKSDKASDNIMEDKGNEQYWDGKEDGLDEALEIVRNGGKK